ncbi:MAG: single-stranded DNA-binding protein [Candidatus Azobacteroides sp.]|nr:single-stranded DNA-binding protein [Candidatus Azobacteroides sp.]
MSINKIILIGHVGKEPEVRYYDNGGAVANFSLATTEKGYTAANGTQIPDRTEWHNIVLWRGLAEIAEKYVHKGSKIYVEGKIRTRSYDDQQGIKRYVTEVWGDAMELLDRKQDNVQSNRPPFPEPSATPSSKPQATTFTPTATQSTPSLPSDESDDLPF